MLAAPYSLTPSVTLSLPIVGSAKSAYLLEFEIQIDPHAPTTQNFRISLPRHHIEPGLAATFRAPELCEQALERFDDSTEFLLAEARPLVVVDRLVDHPLLAAVVLQGLSAHGFHRLNLSLGTTILPVICRLRRKLEQLALPADHRRQEVAEIIREISAVSRLSAKIVGQFAGNVFKMPPQPGGRRLNIVLAEVHFDLLPDLRNLLEDGTGLNAPAVKGNSAFGFNKAFGLHLLGPDLVVSGDDELGTRKTVLEESTELLPVILVDGHHDVIEHREAEAVAKEALHQRQVQADSHTILMALAVVGAWRVHSLVIERDRQIELALCRFELRLERPLVLTIDLAVEVTKITFDCVIQGAQTILRNFTVGGVDDLADLRCLLRPLFGPADLAAGFNAVLC